MALIILLFIKHLSIYQVYSFKEFDEDFFIKSVNFSLPNIKSVKSIQKYQHTIASSVCTTNKFVIIFTLPMNFSGSAGKLSLS